MAGGEQWTGARQRLRFRTLDVHLDKGRRLRPWNVVELAAFNFGRAARRYLGSGRTRDIEFDPLITAPNGIRKRRRMGSHRFRQPRKIVREELLAVRVRLKPDHVLELSPAMFDESPDTIAIQGPAICEHFIFAGRD